MQRTELLDKLLDVSPALSDKDLIPVLTHFWMTGKEVMAFNDQIAISVPCKTEFQGAIPGQLFLNLLKNSKAKTVELIPNGKELTVKAASSKIKLALLPPDDFMFEMPDYEQVPILPVDMDDFLIGVESCLRSVGADTGVPDQLGVTVIPSKDSVALYATNTITISQSIVKCKANKVEGRFILSTLFCNQMLRLAKAAKKMKLHIDQNYALLTLDNGVKMYGHLLHSERPADFESVINDHFKPEMRKHLSPIPSKLKLIIERAMIIASKSVDERATTVTVKDGKMRFVSKSAGVAEISDYMDIGDKHPNVSVRLDPKLLKMGYGSFDNILVTENCAVMVKDNSIYMIAAVG